MRKIKFRWWNGVRMVQNEYLRVLAKNLKNGKDGEYMQFTGLKDCNGVEVFDGDILRNISWGGVTIEPFAVEWNDELTGYDIGHSGNYEVIGNIHENPELLGGEG